MIQDDIQTILTPVIEDMGYVLWGCEYLAQGKHSVLRIYIDHPEGIGIEDCEKVSKQVSSVLDVEDPITGQYQLEISSPGIPKPLFYPWQYEHFVGHEVDIKLFKPIEKTRKYTGVIEKVETDSVVITNQDDSVTIPFTNIVKAYLTV